MFYVRSDQHVKIAVEDLNPRGRKTVFFVHGWPLDHRIFEYQTDRLPSMGYRCISIDLRGFGASDSPAFGYSYDHMARDLYHVIRRMELYNVRLVGFSMGGAIVTRYMALFQGFRVSRLALLAAASPSFVQRPDCPFGMTVEEVDQLIAQAYRDRPAMVDDFGELVFASNPTNSFRSWFSGIGYNASGLGTIETAKSLRDEDLRKDLQAIRVPTVIFHGRLDRVCPFALAEAMHTGIAGSILYSFEHSGHAVFYDELDRFNEQFFDFLV